MIKFEEVTLGEIEEIELMLGRSIEETFGDGKPKGRTLRVLYYIFKRREDSKFKFEDTENITQTEALDYLTGVESKKE